MDLQSSPLSAEKKLNDIIDKDNKNVKLLLSPKIGLLKENISIKLNNHGKKNNVDFFFPIEINLSKTLMNFAK